MSQSVLVVDDDACFRELAARLLRGAGYTVIAEAATAEAAIARAVELEPDVALVDIGLPDGDGFALARQLSAMARPVQVVLISTDSDGGSRPAALRAGACGFLPKDELSGPAFRHLIKDA